MNKIILASHGEFSQGLKQTASMIIGDEGNIFALSAFRDEDEPIKSQVEHLLEAIGYEDVYLLTDIFGGSVNNDLLTLQQQYPELHLVAGMNLPLVISIATQSGKIDADQMAALLEESRQAMIDCKQLLTTQINIGGDDL
ncbi:PTS fructose transporter subunit IIA [Enterococcus hulanensis]|uniref:PTS fructose transporter subunit IIA n=1 Tax=Enterococcus hulanensis TaxID=2559929 RepID=A0ABU3EZA5_9ENTE|nr:PTS fructose transporter subunit IIA [Enterococcus hulanensis]MDT2599628.1 PTS fructose transporter subunit IIA [Enterococcus hulanensis]MDT2609516.1 PTS fructose transporter subunit IIA [Enterococcus hulanensis]MDT2616093.1 PTS fructose transporter subunit IIA [Enterococcus hulanensis]MDT2627867.1 PTS fructose transporter subunit IIA [Enterococcus hulanensis]MDT2654972.1 PTS fructose transporter subunit IIA [Enterococcus hulanensis]